MAEKFLRSLTVGGEKMTFLPTVVEEGDGKVLKVINGEWAVGTLGEVESDPITWLEFSGNEEFTLSTYNTTANWDGTLYYSTDTENWNTWDGTEISSSGNKLYLRGSGNTKITGTNNYRWVLSGNDTLRIKTIGRIDNLLDWGTVLNGEEPEMASICFAHMFRGCTSLTTAPELPATTLASNCYYYMFQGCTSLTTAPELPATTLASNCYYYMFRGCTSLVTAPELPATTLANYCYAYMFYNCTALNLYSTPTGTATYSWTAPASTYTSSMFYNVPLDGSSTVGTPTEGTTYYWDTGSSSSGGY